LRLVEPDRLFLWRVAHRFHCVAALAVQLGELQRRNALQKMRLHQLPAERRERFEIGLAFGERNTREIDAQELGIASARALINFQKLPQTVRESFDVFCLAFPNC